MTRLGVWREFHTAKSLWITITFSTITMEREQRCTLLILASEQPIPISKKEQNWEKCTYLPRELVHHRTNSLMITAMALIVLVPLLEKRMVFANVAPLLLSKFSTAGEVEQLAMLYLVSNGLQNNTKNTEVIV